jgi:beta-glucanase (GH16 family)
MRLTPLLIAALVATTTLAVPAQASADSLLSRGRPVTVSSTESSPYGGALAVDGDTATRWASVEGHDPEWITIDLGSAATLSRVVLKWEAAYAKAYKLEVSDDSSTWRPVFTTTTGNGATDDLTVSGSGRFVRLSGTQRATEWGYSLWEFEVYGSAATPSDWQLTWREEFDEPQGTKPSSAKWIHDTGGEPQWGNEEWQYYTDRPQNVSTDGQGNLAITARRERLPGMENCQYGPCDVTSGRITTRQKFEQAYGRFEARIKVPAGQGLWPAFWMMGNDIGSAGWPNNGEIDIMETIGSEPSTLYGTVHGPGYSGEQGIGGSTNLPDGAKFADAFHTFSVEWAPDVIVWKLDGAQYLSLRKSQLPAGKKWVFDHPFYMLLNLAVGGVWPGPPNSATKFPATLLVDYVRVYTKA